MRLLMIVVALALLTAACGDEADPGSVDPIPEISAMELRALLDAEERPVLLNVWASWCIPCRSEAPLLREAHERYGDEVRFIGLDVRDGQDAARSFLAEFRLDGFDHFFDPTGAVQGSLGAGGVPLTYFFTGGGELSELHYGVIDERTLALNLDEITREG